jgi:GTPase SAR1 family protein
MYIETSAKADINVQKVFKDIAKLIIQQRLGVPFVQNDETDRIPGVNKRE